MVVALICALGPSCWPPPVSAPLPYLRQGQPFRRVMVSPKAKGQRLTHGAALKRCLEPPCVFQMQDCGLTGCCNGTYQTD